MVNLRSPVVKISWPIHLPGRNLSQHSSWSTCCLSWTNRIFSPFWGSLSKWTLWWQPSSLTKSPPTFIMVNLLSLVDKPYLYPLWARQATNEYQDVAESLSEYLTLHLAQNECRNNFHVQFKWIISRVCRYYQGNQNNSCSFMGTSW